LVEPAPAADPMRPWKAHSPPRSRAGKPSSDGARWFPGQSLARGKTGQSQDNATKTRAFGLSKVKFHPTSNRL